MKEIKVTTLPNGYGLDVDGEGFMYFNELDLLAGFMVHVGAREAKPMENGDMLSALASAMIGHEYAKNVEQLRDRMSVIYNKQVGAMKDVDNVTKYVNDCMPKFKTFRGRVDELDRILKVAAENYREATAPVSEAKAMMDGLAKQISNAQDKIKKYEKFFENVDEEAKRMKLLVDEARKQLMVANEMRSYIEDAMKSAGASTDDIKAIKDKYKESTKAEGKKAADGAEKKPSKAKKMTKEEKEKALEKEKAKGNLK